MTNPANVTLRDTVEQYIQAAYLHGLSTENLDTGELEPPRDISEVDWITEAIEARMSKLLIEARIDELKRLPNTKPVWFDPKIHTSYIDKRIKELEGKDND
jgi:hypothetical protein